MLFEVVYLQRRAVVIDTFDLQCAQALVAGWIKDKNQQQQDVTVLSVAPVHAEAKAA